MSTAEGLGAGALFAAIVSLTLALIAWLKMRDVEAHKADLAKDVERVKGEVTKEVEVLKKLHERELASHAATLRMSSEARHHMFVESMRDIERRSSVYYETLRKITTLEKERINRDGLNRLFDGGLFLPQELEQLDNECCSALHDLARAVKEHKGDEAPAEEASKRVGEALGRFRLQARLWKKREWDRVMADAVLKPEETTETTQPTPPPSDTGP